MKKFLGLLGVFLAILMVVGACTTKPKEVEKKADENGTHTGGCPAEKGRTDGDVSVDRPAS